MTTCTVFFCPVRSHPGRHTQLRCVDRDGIAAAYRAAQVLEDLINFVHVYPLRTLCAYRGDICCGRDTTATYGFYWASHPEVAQQARFTDHAYDIAEQAAYLVALKGHSDGGDGTM